MFSSALCTAALEPVANLPNDLGMSYVAVSVGEAGGFWTGHCLRGNTVWWCIPWRCWDCFCRLGGSV